MFTVSILSADHMIALLPEEWRPGENLLGCPWQAVIATALVGVATVTVFIWNTVLAVKKREYLVTEKGLKDHITSLKQGKEDGILKVSELKKLIQQLVTANEKLQLGWKKSKQAFEQKCVEKDYAALKEQNNTLKATMKAWEDKHEDLSKRIKLYQKSQKELEDLVTLKDNNVQTTLFVVEEERNGLIAKFLQEEKTRKVLEEKHQELEHTIATIKSEKSLVENQFKILEQKNEILTEMYQQKQNALQQ
ncbi:hypothetical protein CRUP_008995 [Coryphaenoides rupestris]|nr:hypothetical protein CRUP_008995 [Coryphaenoides rupestris]